MAENSVEKARFNMIEQQVRPWNVLEPRVLETLSEVPREAYVPDAYRGLAFADIEIPLGQGEKMMKPVLEGRLLQALNVQPTDRVLEIGTGSGFLTACLAALGQQVTSLEIHEAFTAEAQKRLDAQGVNNVTLKTADALAEPGEEGAFDAIAVTGSLPAAETAEIFKKQLAEGGRLFVIVGEGAVLKACLITRVDKDRWQQQALFETELGPLANAPVPTSFSL